MAGIESSAQIGLASPRPRWDPERGLVSRPRLTERLQRWRHSPVVLAAAPAGYGKTTILAEWETVDGRPFAWITLDERHDDPSFLASSIATALDRIEPIGPGVFDVLGSARPGLSHALIPRLAEAISTRREPFVLVLDDVHRLEEPESIELITSLSEHLPSGSQFALAARGEPPIPIGRLRAQGRLAELETAELALTRSETVDLLEVAGVSLGPRPLDELTDRTEGWPVAAYLASRSLSDADDAESAIERLTGDDRRIADYIREELTSSLDEEDLDFLTCCSVLDQLDGPLCDAVLDREGSANVLRRLSRSNLLVIPLDRVDRQYRYHALLREMLEAELGRLGAARHAELHARAADWYAEREDFDRAIPHAISSGDLWRGGLLVWTAAPGYSSHGRDATLRRFLGQYSEAQIADSPPLALALAASHLTHGEGAETNRWTAAATAKLDRAPAEYRQFLEANARLLSAAAAPEGELAAIARTVASARSLIPAESPWTALACFVEGTALHLQGKTTEARRLLDEGSSRGRAVPNVRTLCLAQLALLALEQDDEAAAWRLEERATADIDRYGLGDFATEALALAVCALIRARRGRAEDAVRAATRSTELLAQLPGVGSWYEAEARLVLARAWLSLDDIAAAKRHLDDARPHLRNIPDAPVLESMLDATDRALADTASLPRRWPLTPAELRLLHRLPTHLSFREIGDQLFVSTNTVKSQARSIYRKLGVTSRAEAVSCAQAAGLIESPDPIRSPARGDAAPSGRA